MFSLRFLLIRKNGFPAWALALSLGCTVDEHEVLDGKSCGALGECAPGYTCDTASQRCFIPSELRSAVSIDAGHDDFKNSAAGGQTANGGSPAEPSGGADGFGGRLRPWGGMPAGGAAGAGEGPQPILLYTFDGPPGPTIPDVSGREPKIDLRLSRADRLRWSPGFVEITGEMFLYGAGDQVELTMALQASKQLSVEAWIRPADLRQAGPARILSIAPDVYDENFILGQEREMLTRRYRSPGGTDEWDFAALTAELNHVVLTRDAQGNESAYVDGELKNQQTTQLSFEDWDKDYPLTVVNNQQGDRPWLGALYTLAVYDAALTPGRVQALFKMGPR